MINHGELMNILNSAKPGDQTEHNEMVETLTRGGVIKEGGPLAKDVDVLDRISNVMRSDLPTSAQKLSVAGSTESAINQKVADPANIASHRETIPLNSRFVLGAGSMKELIGVNPDLVRCVMLAIKYTSIDFCVYDGIRTVKEQLQHVKDGTSKTMSSKHLDGLAVDLVPWIGGKPVWDWKGCYMIAYAMDTAATELGMAQRITWGGAWDRKLSDFGRDLGSYEQEVTLYRKRHPGSDFIDGPHFEIIR